MKDAKNILSKVCESIEKAHSASESAAKTIKKMEKVDEKIEDFEEKDLPEPVEGILQRIGQSIDLFHPEAAGRIVEDLEGVLNIADHALKSLSAARDNHDITTAVQEGGKVVLAAGKLNNNIGKTLQFFASQGSHVATVGKTMGTIGGPITAVAGSCFTLTTTIIELKRRFGSATVAKALLAVLSYAGILAQGTSSQLTHQRPGFFGYDARKLQSSLLIYEGALGAILWVVSKYDPPWIKSAFSTISTISIPVAGLITAVLSIVATLASVGGLGIPIAVLSSVGLVVGFGRSFGQLFRYYKSQALFRELFYNEEVSIAAYVATEFICSTEPNFSTAIDAHRLGATLSDYWRFQVSLYLSEELNSNVWDQVCGKQSQNIQQIAAEARHNKLMEERRNIANAQERRELEIEQWSSPFQDNFDELSNRLSSDYQLRSEEAERLNEIQHEIDQLSKIFIDLQMLQPQHTAMALCNFKNIFNETLTVGMMLIIKEGRSITDLNKMRETYEKLSLENGNWFIDQMLRLYNLVDDHAVSLNNALHDFQALQKKPQATPSWSGKNQKMQSIVRREINFLTMVRDVLSPFGLFLPKWGALINPDNNQYVPIEKLGFLRRGFQAFKTTVHAAHSTEFSNVNWNWELFTGENQPRVALRTTSAVTPGGGFVSPVAIGAVSAEEAYHKQIRDTLGRIGYQNRKKYAEAVLTRFWSYVYGSALTPHKLQKIFFLLKYLKK